MKVNGSATVAAPVAVVWEALRDPAVLVATIPGCERLEETSTDTYKMTVSAGVASIKGTYVGQVALTDPEPPVAFTLRAQGQGAPGTVDATVRVRLSEAAGGTRVDYDADAVVGGMIGGVGQRMLAVVGKKTAGEFFAAVERAIIAPKPNPTPQPSLTTPTATSPAPAPVPPGPVPHGTWTPPPAPDNRSMLTAFGAGGAIALAGVVVGWLVGRSRS
jgi:uncharacterized protein